MLKFSLKNKSLLREIEMLKLSVGNVKVLDKLLGSEERL